MRILHVTQGYAPAVGGTERLVQRVSEECVARWHDAVTVYTTDCYNGEAFFSPHLPRLPQGWSSLNGVQVRRFPVARQISRLLRGPQALAYRLRLPHNDRLRTLAGGPIIRGLRGAIAAQPADVIVAASFPLQHMYAALGAAGDSRRPCVLIGCLHPADRWGFERPSIYRAIREADAYIALTSFEAGYVIDRGARPDRVHAIGAGVDAERYAGIPADEAKWRLGLDGRRVVGFIGQLAQHKGIDTLLRAMPRVWRVDPETALLIAGGRTLFAEQLTRVIDEWPASYRRRVVLDLDFPDARKPWLFAACDILASPSGFESFGIVYLEAWAAGKPVIGARSGAVQSVIDEGVDGLLVDYQDEFALARTVLDLLAEPRRAAAMGEAGRAKVLSRYTWPLVADRFRAVYASAAATT